MAMSKKHYDELAALFKQAHRRARTQREHGVVCWLTNRTAGICKIDNPKFQPDMFLYAADFHVYFTKE